MATAEDARAGCTVFLITTGQQTPSSPQGSLIYDVHSKWEGGASGGTPKADDSTDKLCGCDIDKGEVVPKSKSFLDVIRKWSLSPVLALRDHLGSRRVRG